MDGMGWASDWAGAGTGAGAGLVWPGLERVQGAIKLG